MNEGIEVIKKQVQVYFEKNIPIHLELKDGHFYNGRITLVSSDYFMLDEKLLGDMPVFYQLIDKLEVYEK